MPATEQADAWWRAYVRAMTARMVAYQVQLLGWGEAEVEKRAATAACLDRERELGRIR